MTSKSPYFTLAGLVGVSAILVAATVANAPERVSTPAAPATNTTATGSTTEPTTESPTKPVKTRTQPPRTFPARAVYAGHTAKSGPALAVAILGDDAVAYFCDGVEAESWMTGTVRRDELDVRGKDRASVRGRLTKGVLSGTATVKGRTYPFALPAAKAPAGLYRAKSSDAQTTIGWIVLSDGSQVGISNERGLATPAPTLQPGRGVGIDGQRVVPHEVQGDEEF